MGPPYFVRKFYAVGSRLWSIDKWTSNLRIDRLFINRLDDLQMG